MPLYEYQARNARSETVQGTVEAPTVSQAVNQLEGQGFVILTIGEVATEPFQPRELALGTLPPTANEGILEHWLADAVKESSSLLPALRALAAEQPATLHRRKLMSFIKVLECGDLAAAAASFERLAEYWIPLISATRAHEPAATLVRFFKEWRDAHRLTLQSRLAMSYGLVVLSAAAVVMTGVCVFIVPTFANIFAGFGLRMPALTRFVVGLSEWVITGRILAVVVGATAVLGIIWFILRRLPRRLAAVFGDRFGTFFGRSAALSRLTGYAADLLEAQAPTSVAMELAALASRSPRLVRAARRWQLGGTRTSGITASVWRVLPSTVRYAFDPGIADDARVALLRELSRVYSERALARTSWTRGIVEPLAILFIGANVGVVVLALFLPLISLVQGLS